LQPPEQNVNHMGFQTKSRPPLFAPNQLFSWRRLVAQGGLTAADSGEEVVPASDYRTLQNQIRELHRLLGKKTEAEIFKEALEHATGSKKQLRLPPSPPRDGSR
jgi:transposase